MMKRFDMHEVVGELFAGMILGPFALGSLQISGEPLVAFNEHVLTFAEVGDTLRAHPKNGQVSCECIFKTHTTHNM